MLFLNIFDIPYREDRNIDLMDIFDIILFIDCKDVDALNIRNINYFSHMV